MDWILFPIRAEFDMPCPDERVDKFQVADETFVKLHKILYQKNIAVLHVHCTITIY